MRTVRADRKFYGPDRKLYGPDRKFYGPDRSGLQAVLIIVLLLLLLFYSESSIDFNMQTQQDSPKFSKL